MLYYRQSGDSQEVALNYRQLEEAVNRWTLDLEEQEKIFLQQATQVNAWDRVLVENGDKVCNLLKMVARSVAILIAKHGRKVFCYKKR